jgi:hypothetical protein
MAVDFESAEMRAYGHQVLELPPSPMVVRTQKGFHEYFRTLLADQGTIIKWNGLDIDLLFGPGRQAVWPPSFIAKTSWEYEWVGKGPVPVSDLPLFPDELVREHNNLKQNETVKAVVKTNNSVMAPITNPKSYVLRIESKSGSRGFAALLRAAVVLKSCNFTKEDAIAFLWNEWNRRADLVVPPWPLKSIESACNRIFDN